MHGLWNTFQKFRREECNAYCRGNLHAMVVWTNLDIDGTEESLAGWNPEVEILAVGPAPEVRSPDGELGQMVRDGALHPMLVRFRVVMETPEAA